MRASGENRRFRLASPTVAWWLAGFVVLVLAAALVLLGLNSSRMAASGTNFYGILAVAAILAVAVGLYAGAGCLIASRLPGNAVGWLLCLTGLSIAVTMLTEQYAVYGLATAPGSVPAARLAGWSSNVVAALTIVQLLLLVLLFPDGRLPSRRWRPVLWAMSVVVVGAVTGQMQAGTIVSGGITNSLATGGVAYRNPLGIFPEHGWSSDLFAMIVVLAVIVAALAVASVFVRRRAASAERRKQLAWLGYVGLMTAVWGVVLVASSPLAHGANRWLGTAIWSCLFLTLVAGLPLACAVAVLKYRLYEIDRLISRTLAYAIVTGLLIGVYTGLVLLATKVLPLHDSVAVAGSTLVAAAMFSPLRRRVQRAVDRRFNRARYDAEQTVTEFASRLQDTTDLDQVLTELVSAVNRSLEPAHLSAWTASARRAPAEAAEAARAELRIETV
jgi:hypothetical protein